MMTTSREWSELSVSCPNLTINPVKCLIFSAFSEYKSKLLNFHLKHLKLTKTEGYIHS